MLLFTHSGSKVSINIIYKFTSYLTLNTESRLIRPNVNVVNALKIGSVAEM
jgi:hypothetical protein